MELLILLLLGLVVASRAGAKSTPPPPPPGEDESPLESELLDPEAHIAFKESNDAQAWALGMGSAAIRRYMVGLANIFNQFTKAPFVITSWYRENSTNHAQGEAFDVRRLSSQNRVLTEVEAQTIETEALAWGIPLEVHDRGTSQDHWHVGRGVSAAILRAGARPAPRGPANMPPQQIVRLASDREWGGVPTWPRKVRR